MIKWMIAEFDNYWIKKTKKWIAIFKNNFRKETKLREYLCNLTCLILIMLRQLEKKANKYIHE